MIEHIVWAAQLRSIKLRASTRPLRGRLSMMASGSLLIIALSACSLSPLESAPAGPVSALPVSQSAAQAIISGYRKGHGLSEVTLDATLQKAAQQQAMAMAKANELSHEVDGTLPRRLARNGVDPGAAIENVSAGYASLASAIQSWKDSPEHNKNLLNTRMRRMGIAEAAAPKTRFKTFWSVIMTD